MALFVLRLSAFILCMYKLKDMSGCHIQMSTNEGTVTTRSNNSLSLQGHASLAHTNVLEFSNCDPNVMAK